VGTLHEVKGQSFLLQAVRILQDRQAMCTLHFVGDGPDMSRLRALARELRVEHVTTFHGRQNRHQVASLLQTADIVVAPSVPTADGRKEGIPVALMEAMASGVAVIGSRLSGIPELIHDGTNGLLVSPRDVEGLADAIERLVRDQGLRTELGTRGRRTVEDRFNLQTSANTLVNLFHRSKEGNANVGRSIARGAIKPCA
jgi:glycosyltransferase involved in cell wall biosynthesis